MKRIEKLKTLESIADTAKHYTQGFSDIVINEVANYYGIDARIIYSKKRDRQTIYLRNVAIYILYNISEPKMFSYKNLQKIFNKKDHSTIVNALKNIEKSKKTDKLLVAAIFQIKRNINFHVDSLKTGD